MRREISVTIYERVKYGEGFYSIACVRKPDGSLDRDTVMVGARARLTERLPEQTALRVPRRCSE